MIPGGLPAVCGLFLYFKKKSYVRSVLLVLFALSITSVSTNETRASQSEYNVDSDYAAVEPQFSDPSGYIAENSRLSLSAPEGYAVYYTVDGSKPTTDSIKYTGEIVLEAPPSILTVDEDQLPDIPVISLVMEYNDLLDYELLKC